MKEKTYQDRIRFLTGDQIMEVDFADMTFDVSKSVNGFYDAVDSAIEKTGQKWFFLVNYHNCRIMTEAWIAFAHRGKKANLSYSLGTARYAASEETSEAIVERSKEENFDPSLFPSRDKAIGHLQTLRREIDAASFERMIKIDAPAPARPIEDRITFHPDLAIMECDFSDLTFENSSQVNACYDVIEHKLAPTGKKWYFLVNYRNCVIMPDAWIAFASRGKKLNLAHSSGSVRFDAGIATQQSIVDDSRKQDFDPNLFDSREAALARIGDMRADAAN